MDYRSAFRDYRLGLTRWLLTFIALFTAGLSPLGAQENKRLDSLHAIVSGTEPDTAKISALIELSRMYTGIDDDRAFALAKQSLAKSEESGSAKWKGFALNRLGTLYDVKGKPDSATIFLIRGLKIFEEIRHLPGLAAVYQNMGVMHYYQKDFDRALENYRKALALREQTGEMSYVAQLYNNIGSVLRRKKEYDSAIVYYKKALEIKKGLDDKQSLASSLINISVAYQYKNDFAAAIEYGNQAAALCRETGNDYDLASAHIGLGEIYLKMKHPREAFAQARAALALAQKLKSNELLFNIYEELALCDTLAGDYKAAFSDYVNAMYYKDQVYTKEKAEAISRLQTFYETEKKDNEIRVLNADNETRRKQQSYLLAILLLSVVLLVIASWAFLNKQRDNRLLRKQKFEIESKTELLKEQAAQIARLSSQMNPHFLFNALNSLQKFVLSKDETRTLAYISQLSALMRDTLNNSSKAYITLQEELEYLGKYLSFEKNLMGDELRFTVDTDSVDRANTLIPPMLIQPLVENAIKHGLAGKSGNKEVFVGFSAENQHLRVTVRDNGVGRIGARPGHQSKALGITQSRLRSEFEKQGMATPPSGVFAICDLQDPRGTEVTLVVPLILEF